MATVLVLQHEPGEGPGTLGEALRAAGHSLEIVHTYLGEEVPQSLDSYRGLLVLGGEMTVRELDRHPFLRREILLVKDALAAERPVFGICLGAQVLAAALGARVYALHWPEVGWHAVKLTEAARFDPLWSRAPSSFPAFHWHNDTFELPRSTELVASSSTCAHQAFSFGERVFGVQFHPEVDEKILRTMAAGVPAELARKVLEPMAAELPRYQATMRVIFDAWAALVR